MENCIIYNGKQIPLTDKQIEMFELNNEDKISCFDHVNNDDFYYIETYGTVSSAYDEGEISYYEHLYAVGNYCSDKKLMQQRAYYETLNRLIWRFKMVNDCAEPNDTWGGVPLNWVIEYNTGDFKVSGTTVVTFKTFGTLLFNYKKIAYQAIEEVIKPFLKEHPSFKLEEM